MSEYVKESYYYDIESLLQPIGFGKHAKMKLEYLCVHDPDYVKWMIEKSHAVFSPTLKKFIENAFKYSDSTSRSNYLFSFYRYFLSEEKNLNRQKELEQKKATEKYVNPDLKKKSQKLKQEYVSKYIEEIVLQIKDNSLTKLTETDELIWSKKTSKSTGSQKIQEYFCNYKDTAIYVRLEKILNRDLEWKSYYSVNLDYQGIRKAYKGPEVPKLFKAISDNYVPPVKIDGDPYGNYVKSEPVEKVELSFNDIVVRCNKFYCHHYHRIVDVIAIFMVADKTGKIKEISLTAGYCEDCDVYFILEKIYKKLETYGTILHQVIKHHVFLSGAHLNEDRYDGRSPYSPLRTAGYNVNAKDNLSDRQRQMILEYVIDSGILTKSEVLMYLDMFITERQNQPNMQAAISKWEKDYAYIVNYELKSAKLIRVNKITKTIRNNN